MDNASASDMHACVLSTISQARSTSETKLCRHLDNYNRAFGYIIAKYTDCKGMSLPLTQTLVL